MEVLLALGAAVSYGTSDFAGGILARRTHVFVVVLLSQLVATARGSLVVWMTNGMIKANSITSRGALVQRVSPRAILAAHVGGLVCGVSF